MAAGETTVTLTGEEASLHKALQKVIDQNLKMVGGFDKAKNKAKQLADVDFDELNDAFDELGDLSSVFQSVTDSSIGKMVTSISLATMGMAAFKAIIDESIERFEILGKIGTEQLEKTRSIATGQQEAAKNLVSLSPDEFRNVQENIVPQIQRDTNFSDRGLLSQAYGEVRSILDPKQTEELLAVSARLNRLTPENLVPTATSIADIVRNVGVSIDEAVGMLATSQTVFRAPDQKMVAKGIADVSAAAIGTSSPTAKKTEVADQATAFLSVIGKDDAEGRSSITATLSFMDQLRDPFTQKSKEDRDKRFTELQRQIDMETEEQRKLAIEIQRTEQIANQFAPTDDSPKAQIARNAAGKAKRDLERSIADQQRAEKDMARIARIQSTQISDPGTPEARLQAIIANPDLRAETVNNLKGEIAFRDEMEALLTPGSDLFKQYQSNRQAIDTDPKKAKNLFDLLDATSQQKQASAVDKSDVNREAFDAESPHLATSAAIRKIRDDAKNRRNVAMRGDYYLERTINGTVDGVMNYFFSTTLQGLNDANNIQQDPEAAARDAIEQLNNIRLKIYDLKEPQSAEYDKFLQDQIKAVDEQRQLYRARVSKGNGALDPAGNPSDTAWIPQRVTQPEPTRATVAPSVARPDPQMEKNNELLQRQNEILQAFVSSFGRSPVTPPPPPPPSPATIEAQVRSGRSL